MWDASAIVFRDSFQWKSCHPMHPKDRLNERWERRSTRGPTRFQSSRLIHFRPPPGWLNGMHLWEARRIRPWGVRVGFIAVPACGTNSSYTALAKESQESWLWERWFLSNGTGGAWWLIWQLFASCDGGNKSSSTKIWLGVLVHPWHLFLQSDYYLANQKRDNLPQQ
jgi:hypothetical protein